MVIEQVSVSWGATIISVSCQDEDAYGALPEIAYHNNVKCGKCSFHPDKKLAFYRSGHISTALAVYVPPEPTEHELMRMTNDELVQAGYLIIRKRGNITTYIPTAKYKNGMNAATMPELPTTTISKDGVVVYEQNAVRGLLSAYVAEGDQA